MFTNFQGYTQTRANLVVVACEWPQIMSKYNFFSVAIGEARWISGIVDETAFISCHTFLWYLHVQSINHIFYLLYRVLRGDTHTIWALYIRSVFVLVCMCVCIVLKTNSGFSLFNSLFSSKKINIHCSWCESLKPRKYKMYFSLSLETFSGRYIVIVDGRIDDSFDNFVRALNTSFFSSLLFFFFLKRLSVIP